MANGQDWTDTLDARAAGKVLGFSESGAPIDTADVPPDEREVLDVKFFAAVEPPPTSDPRDARIAELEAQLRTEQDRRIAELESAIADAQTAPAPVAPGSSAAPAPPVAPASSAAPAPPVAPAAPAPVAQLGETAPPAPDATSTTTAPASAFPPPPPAPAHDAAATAEAQGAAPTGTPADPGSAPQ